MPLKHSFLLPLTVLGLFSPASFAADPTTHLKDETRPLWTRSQERFIRRWQVLGEIPLTKDLSFTTDCFAANGGEASLKPDYQNPPKLANGTAVSWRWSGAWGDFIDLSDGNGIKRDLVGYAYTTIQRAADGPALLTIGSDESVRAWVNGQLVLDRQGPRGLAFDDDRVEVNLHAGENSLLVKLEQHTGAWAFVARVLEPGAIPPRVQEIGPGFVLESPSALVVKTDANRDHASESPVTVQIVAAGGRILQETNAARGESVRFDPSAWPDGAYEIRCVTHQLNGCLYSTHLAWYKGDAITAARRLVEAAGKADVSTPIGQTIKMLGDLVQDRLGAEGLAVKGNPWWVIHSPLMEYEELLLEQAGQSAARARSLGFYRLAWRDEIDGSPQFARAYLPPGYDRSKKWPVLLRLHGYNPANPVYVRWWGVDSRHSFPDVEYGNHQGVIYVEPHGRGNNSYLGLGDMDVVRVIQLLKETFSIDDDRVYLSGDSMGGWGTWNVGTRHPDLFAALAPIYGGVDYHSTLSEAELAALTPFDRLLREKQSTWSMAEGLLNVPVFVHHGDVDQAVNVEWSRYGVHLLQRWGYDVRYMEMPGYGHEDLNQFPQIIDWLLAHRRQPQPAHVRLRSIELQNATAYWVAVEQAARPDRYMVVDGEVVAPNTIRIDTDNVLALSLRPGAELVNRSEPVKVVWNGKAFTEKLVDGRITLRAGGFSPAPREKNARIAGPISAIYTTPFAIVVGTAAADPAMNDVLRRQGEALINGWLEWQRQPPRHFKDSEITDADIQRYSLILLGDAASNLVARKLSAQLPLKVSASEVTVGGRVFSAPDSRVQMIFPHPGNADRYVVVVAGTSAQALEYWSPSGLRDTAVDFTIDDQHVSVGKPGLSRQDVWVAGGWFDHAWSRNDDYIIAGKSEARANTLVLQPALAVEALEAYVGEYRNDQGGPTLVITRKDRHLHGGVPGQQTFELFPAGKDQFYVADGSLLIAFQRDAAGGVSELTSTQMGRPFSAKRVQPAK